MKNYQNSGDVLELAAPYAVNSGAGALIGSIFGVATKTLSNGEVGNFAITGTFELAKADSQAWTVGAKIYWDNTNKVCTTTSSGNTLIGVAVEAVANTAGLVLGKVRLGIVA